MLISICIHKACGTAVIDDTTDGLSVLCPKCHVTLSKDDIAVQIVDEFETKESA